MICADGRVEIRVGDCRDLLRAIVSGDRRMSLEGRETYDPHRLRKLRSIRCLAELDGFISQLRLMHGGLPAEAMREIERKRADLTRQAGRG